MDVTDAELLRRFQHQRDADAFAQLLERYASLVWGVCRRILWLESDCEDAFQATFLALLRRPEAVDPSQSLGAWLHTVAGRVAHRTLTRSRRQQPSPIVPDQEGEGDVPGPNVLKDIGTAAGLPALEAVQGPDALHAGNAIRAIRERLPLTAAEWPHALDDLQSGDPLLRARGAPHRRPAARRLFEEARHVLRAAPALILLSVLGAATTTAALIPKCANSVLFPDGDREQREALRRLARETIARHRALNGDRSQEEWPEGHRLTVGHARRILAMLGEEDSQTRKEFARPLDAHHDP
jgi:RNA polymerase sigma factor (sigma-70 family)